MWDGPVASGALDTLAGCETALHCNPPLKCCARKAEDMSRKWVPAVPKTLEYDSANDVRAMLSHVRKVVVVGTSRPRTLFYDLIELSGEQPRACKVHDNIDRTTSTVHRSTSFTTHVS